MPENEHKKDIAISPTLRVIDKEGERSNIQNRKSHFHKKVALLIYFAILIFYLTNRLPHLVP